jgi:hypothetical protein
MDGDIAPLEAWFQEAFLYAPGLRIAGGSDEILRNIIAERVLGMPGDIRPRQGRTIPRAEIRKAVDDRGGTARFCESSMPG